MIASLAASGSYLAGKLGGVAPLYWMGLAIAEGNMGCLAATLAICIVPFAAIYAVLAATFLHTATAKRGAAKIKYVQREQKVSSPFSALYRRELARFTSSSGYLINAGLGAIFMPREIPSVENSEMQRTLLSPMSCTTSITTLRSSSWISMAL